MTDTLLTPMANGYGIHDSYCHCLNCEALRVVRDDEIYRRYMLGETLQSLGDSFGITRERVRQIVEWQRVTRGDYSLRLSRGD